MDRQGCLSLLPDSRITGAQGGSLNEALDLLLTGKQRLHFPKQHLISGTGLLEEGGSLALLLPQGRVIKLLNLLPTLRCHNGKG